MHYFSKNFKGEIWDQQLHNTIQFIFIHFRIYESSTIEFRQFEQDLDYLEI
jgi:hypothetical protein